MGDIVRDLLGTVQDLRKTLDKQLQEWKVEHAAVKKAIAGLNTEANLLKGEANVASYSFKLAGKDFNLQEFLTERRAEREAQQTINDIKSSIAELKERLDRLHRFVGQGVVRPLNELHGQVRELPSRINRAANQATRANDRLDALRAQVSRSAPQQQAHIGNTRSFSETAERINHLEARINSLAQALG
ncbi:hypothetical protein ABZ547_00600 [Streptomyces sparsogenes]|uniref:hypothetical protein n=1 Tax=Streptomyces sparsogenes TaxID=67365 RepID=UPI0033CE4371